MTFITEATLDGNRVAVVFGDAIVTATETLSLDEAPTLAVTVIDPDGDLVNSTLVKRLAVDDALPPVLAYGSRQYVLVEADKQPGRILALTFEQLEVYLLRLFHDYRKAVRGHISREMFAQSLCREAGVKFYAPEAGPPAPKYAPSTALPTPAAGAAAGFIAKVFINQAPATSDELDSLSIALDEAIRLGCTQDMMVGMVMVGTGESSWQRRNLNHDGAGHYGIFQQDPRYYTRPDAFSVKQATHEFLVGGRAVAGGPGTWDIVHNVPITDTPQPSSWMALMKGFTGQNQTIGSIANIRQNPHPGDPAGGAKYAAYINGFHAEAKRTVAAYQSPGRKQNHTVLLKNDRYEFTRGLPGKPETSWDALGRLASEIGWRRFIVGDTVWFVADEWLFATKSIATITEGNGAVDDVAWIWDRGKPIDELDVSVDDTWIHAPGVVFTVDAQGPATGQWLLSEWSRDLLEPSGTLRLVKPGQTLPEPVGDQSGKGWKRAPKPTTDATAPTGSDGVRVARWALSYAGDVQGAYGRAYVWGAKHGVPISVVKASPHPSPPFDCSSFVRWAWGSQTGIDIAARGANDATYGQIESAKKQPGISTGGPNTIPLNGFQPGDVVYVNGGGHVVVMVTATDCVSAEQPATGIQRRPLSWHSSVFFWARWDGATPFDG